MQCPQCNNEVSLSEANHGALFTCPRCMAVYFINFEGQPEYGDMSIEPPVDQFVEQSSEVDSSFIQTENLTASQELPPVQFDENNLAPDNPVTESFLTSSEASDFLPQDNSSDISTESILAGSSAFEVAANEIASYGNQEELISQINYDVHIKGLDTKEVLQAFKEAIDDSKFGWLAEDIMSQIKNGESSFSNLNPIKAFVLAQRIQFLDLDIEWKQNVDF